MIRSMYISILLPMVLSHDTDIHTLTKFTNCKVNICAMGDDTIALDLSQDGGVTFPTKLLPQSTKGWRVPITYTYNSLLTTDTRFLFTVTDAWYDN